MLPPEERLKEHETYLVWSHIRHEQRVSLGVVATRKLEKSRERETIRQHAFLPHFQTGR